MCKVLQIPRSTYYYEAKERATEDDITSDVIDIFHTSRQNYGTRKIKVELKKRGLIVSRRRIGRIMQEQGLVSTRVVIREKELMQVIVDDLQALFNTLKEDNYEKTLLNKLNKKKQIILKELKAAQSEIESLKMEKLEYVKLHINKVITQDELVDYREITDSKIKSLQLKLDQLRDKIQECENENYAIQIGNKLKDILTLNELTPEILHSLVKKINCNKDGDIHIHYSFVNPLQYM